MQTMRIHAFDDDFSIVFDGVALLTSGGSPYWLPVALLTSYGVALLGGGRLLTSLE